MKKLVIAGGTGFLGQVLARHFTRKNWDVVLLTRQQKAKAIAGRSVSWDGRAQGTWESELEGAEALINLCGKSVNCRYHRRNREAILSSRILPTNVLADAIQKAKCPPKVWLNAASATVYRHSLDAPMDEEEGEIGHGFSVDICRAWENAFFEADLPASIRRVALRTAMVLGYDRNSVYPILARLCKLGLGGKMSRGNQMVSWIHQADFARAVNFAIEEEHISGTLNITAPAPVRNDVFMQSLRTALGVPFGLPHYKPMLEIAAWMMRTETELTLKSRYVIPKKLTQNRFVFHYPFIDEAFRALQKMQTIPNPQTLRGLPFET